MRILITGANGFVGFYLVQRLLEKDYQVIATGKGESRLPFKHPNLVYERMDFTDPFAVHDTFETHRPDVVIHAGANSKPDECELNQWDAYVSNIESTLTVLLNAEESKSFFIILSTDFVFDGENDPYREEDALNPVNFYGKTKQQAEEAVMEYPFDWAIVRTSLVYGKPQTGRNNLLTVVKEKLEKGVTYNVFDDQLRTPTYVEDLAGAIVAIIEKKAKGIFHISGKDAISPYQAACLVAVHLGLDQSLINRVTENEFKQAARRPPKTRFILDKARRVLGYDPISFEKGMIKTFSG